MPAERTPHVGAVEEREKQRERPYPSALAIRFSVMTTPPREAAKELGPDAVSGSWLRFPPVEVRVHRGEPILLHWYAHEDGEAVRGITRVETSDGRLSRVRNYFYTPDVIAEICQELGEPFRVNGYRYWPAP